MVKTSPTVRFVVKSGGAGLIQRSWTVPWHRERVTKSRAEARQIQGLNAMIIESIYQSFNNLQMCQDQAEALLVRFWRRSRDRKVAPLESWLASCPLVRASTARVTNLLGCTDDRRGQLQLVGLAREGIARWVACHSERLVGGQSHLMVKR